MAEMEQVEIQFPGVASADAGRLADDLADLIRRENQNAKVSVERASSDAMDGGTILVLVLGTPVAIALAKGVADWIRKQGDPDLIIKNGKEEIVVKSGLSPDQKFELVKTALNKKSK